MDIESAAAAKRLALKTSAFRANAVVPCALNTGTEGRRKHCSEYHKLRFPNTLPQTIAAFNHRSSGRLISSPPSIAAKSRSLAGWALGSGRGGRRSRAVARPSGRARTGK